MNQISVHLAPPPKPFKTYAQLVALMQQWGIFVEDLGENKDMSLYLKPVTDCDRFAPSGNILSSDDNRPEIKASCLEPAKKLAPHKFF